jgi:hypothetical protein
MAQHSVPTMPVTTESMLGGWPLRMRPCPAWGIITQQQGVADREGGSRAICQARTNNACDHRVYVWVAGHRAGALIANHNLRLARYICNGFLELLYFG